MSIQPPIGRIFIAAALNASSSDSLKLLNERTNISWSALHLTQPIPVQGNYPDIGSLDDTETDAILYLTLEPTISLNLISTDEWKLLVTQCVSLNSKGRRVLLRLAPEMNAYWRSWGLKPTQFKKTWSTVHALLKKETNNTDLVWSPAQGAGYPFSQNVTNRMSLDDLAALDTNKDGKIDSQDDPYMPFYPGDDLVDWVGLSIYHLGSEYPWKQNIKPALGKFEQQLTGTNISTNGDFYKLFAGKKPIMISETGAAFYKSIGGTAPFGNDPNDVIKTSWLRQMFNRTFLAKYPAIQMISLLEQQRPGTGDTAGFQLDFTTTFDKLFNDAIGDIEERFAQSQPYKVKTWETPQAIVPTPDNNSPPLTGFILLGIFALAILTVIGWIGYVFTRRHLIRRGTIRGPAPPETPPETKVDITEVDDNSTVAGDELSLHSTERRSSQASVVVVSHPPSDDELLT